MTKKNEGEVVVLGLADAGQEGWRQDTESQGYACATTGLDGGGSRKSKIGTTPTM